MTDKGLSQLQKLFERLKDPIYEPDTDGLGSAAPKLLLVLGVLEIAETIIFVVLHGHALAVGRADLHTLIERPCLLIAVVYVASMVSGTASLTAQNEGINSPPPGRSMPQVTLHDLEPITFVPGVH